ncbi:MAG TPA: Gfo/Idh/MocA family protein [Xenococcaceae cyanobacterium]
MITKIAVVGCGFVAGYYLKTFANHPNLKLVGVMDRDSERATKLAQYYSVKIYQSLSELLQDSTVELVVNLTNPRNHYEISKACLEAGKHVYSEKPLAMEYEQAADLVNLAEQKGLYISCAPCNVLSETAQTIWKALRENVIGKVRVVYAEMDDGMIHKMAYRKWFNNVGVPWPYKDEFEVGCTLEHAGYYVTWLTAFFGAAESVTAFSSCVIDRKVTDTVLEPPDTPDFSVACIKFASGIVARLTCSIIAPHDHALTIVGDEGLLCTEDCWNYESPVYIKRRLTIRRKTMINPLKQKYPLVRKQLPIFNLRRDKTMDFARGVAELAEAIAEKRTCRLASRYVLHVNEIVLAIHHTIATGYPYKLKSAFAAEDIQPMVWAK